MLIVECYKYGQRHLSRRSKLLLDKIVKSERLSKKMYSLAQQEISMGKNMYALYSAFTNYSSYADERNGFSLRNTGNDTKGESMWKREQQVDNG